MGIYHFRGYPSFCWDMRPSRCQWRGVFGKIHMIRPLDGTKIYLDRIKIRSRLSALCLFCRLRQSKRENHMPVLWQKVIKRRAPWTLVGKTAPEEKYRLLLILQELLITISLSGSNLKSYTGRSCETEWAG